MTEWKHLIIISVELMICGLVIFYAVFLNNVGRTASEIQQNEANAIELLAEYREYNKYDNTIIWSQDVISTILQYRGLPEVEVRYKTPVNGASTVRYVLGMTYYNSSTRKQESVYTNEYLTPQFNVSAKFHSTIHKDENGTIDLLIMEEQ